MRIALSDSSFVPGQRLVISILPDTDGERALLNQRLSVEVARVDPNRTRPIFKIDGIPSGSGNALELAGDLPSELKPGIYLVGRIAVTSDAGVTGAIEFNQTFFGIRSAIEVELSEDELARRVADLSARRRKYNNKVYRTTRTEQGHAAVRRFKVKVFGMGCLLHSAQDMDGYVIQPIGSAMSHRSLLDIVNCALSGCGIEQIPFLESTEREFEANSPAFVVTYRMVEAIDQSDAIDFCRAHARALFSILGIERGQKPSEFCLFALEYDTSTRWHTFVSPIYQGNLAADFNEASTADSVDRHLPKLRSDPFLRLLASTYADATSETDYGFALLRYWSVLELVAKKRVGPPYIKVLHPDGVLVVNDRGSHVHSNSKNGRIYEYILRSREYEMAGTFQEGGAERRYMVGRDANHPGYQPGTELFTLWDLVRASYAIRNAIAHSGQFLVDEALSGTDSEQLAAKLKKRGAPDPLKFVQTQAQQALWRETS